jgi:hypothetical protein
VCKTIQFKKFAFLLSVTQKFHDHLDEPAFWRKMEFAKSEKNVVAAKKNDKISFIITFMQLLHVSSSRLKNPGQSNALPSKWENSFVTPNRLQLCITILN